jgi:hypothetical protein
MGVLFKTFLWFWDDAGVSGATKRVSLPAPFSTHEHRASCCSAASHLDAEEAVCPFVVSMR